MNKTDEQENEHTPLPWWYNKERRAIEARPDNHNIETPAYQVLDEADGELIVRAVNSHEALFEAAQYALNRLKRLDENGHGEHSYAIDKLETAIAQAEGKNP